VRGYGKRFTKLIKFFNQYGDSKSIHGDNEFKAALKASGDRTPLDYTSKFFVFLDAGMSARQAVKTIYSDLLATMQRNRQGIIDDIDSEFLHDFRVAVRRTRSAMSLIKNVLEPEVAERFQEEFRYLGQVTGPTRDLDVYLLMENNYKARLPERLQTGLHYFFEDLAQRRSQEQRRLARALRGSRYQQIVTDWQEYLDRDDRENPTSKSDTPVEQIARKIILKRCLRVVRDGRAIHQDTPDSELHRLRIQGKKLRYSLEFFSSLFPDKKMKKLINQLKLLQDNLGDFNDLSVQQDMLREYLADIRPRTVKSKELAAAIAGLLTNLYHQHRRVRTHFKETFAHFASDENLAVYQELFG
jgi:CHAD domain-containing protein